MLQINHRTHLIRILILSKLNRKLSWQRMGKFPNLLHYPTLANQMSAITPTDRTQEERTTDSKIINDNKKE